MKIYVHESLTNDDLTSLRFLLSPYDLDFRGEDGSDITICRNTVACAHRPLIRIPDTHDSRSLDFKEHDNGIIDIPFDILALCFKSISSVMNPRTSLLFNISCRLPIEYNIIPSSLRTILLRMMKSERDFSIHLTNEIARKMLAQAFDELKLPLRRTTTPSLLITHDIDTEKGLRRALSIKKVEEELGLKSAWFVPSDQYHIPAEIAHDLAQDSIIGSHDTRHDGRLILMQRCDQLVERLKKSKQKLESIFERQVNCFRSPLLQFSRTIITALREADYSSDFSLPCWEPVHPATMSGFGIESTQEFSIGGVTEFPLTLFQDHQVLNVFGMNTHEAVKFWLEQAKLIRLYDGNVVLLTHPDYAFSRDLPGYRKLLESLLEIQNEQFPFSKISDPPNQEC